MKKYVFAGVLACVMMSATKVNNPVFVVEGSMRYHKDANCAVQEKHGDKNRKVFIGTKQGAEARCLFPCEQCNH